MYRTNTTEMGQKIPLSRPPTYQRIVSKGLGLLALLTLLLIADVGLQSRFPTNVAFANNGVTWTDKVGVDVTGNTITRTAPCCTWGDAGAASVETIPTGQDGWAATTVDQDNTTRIFGLSTSNPDAHRDSIEYGVHLNYDGAMRVTESGNVLGYPNAFGGYTIGDVIKIERQGSIIVYKRNEITFYTSTVPSTGSLMVDTSFWNPGASLSDVELVSWPEQEAKLVANDAAPQNWFGYSVAVSGDTAIIGAPYAGGGAAYIYTRSGITWTQQTKLVSDDLNAADRFGIAVALDGDTAIVGANNAYVGSPAAGAAYVFQRNGSTWTQQAKLTAADAGQNDQFGIAVAIDDDTAVVGAYFDADAGNKSGSAYVFQRGGTTWSEQAKLTAADADVGDEFGNAVAIDGDTVVVGAHFDDDPLINSGAVYVFQRSCTIWNQEAKLIHDTDKVNDEFGISVAISNDTVVVGAIYNEVYIESLSGLGTAGASYVFQRNGTTWSEQDQLTADNPAVGDEFGISVGIDGDTIVVGSHFDDDDGNSSGSAYVFQRNGTSWGQNAKLTADDAEGADRFGVAVAISGDTAVVGAQYGDADPMLNTGAAYVFHDGDPVTSSMVDSQVETGLSELNQKIYIPFVQSSATK